MMIRTYIETLIAADWSQKRIAEESGIKQSCLSRIIHGTQDDVLYKFGKRLELLAGREGARMRRAESKVLRKPSGEAVMPH